MAALKPLVVAAALLALAACGPGEAPRTEGGPLQMRRLSEAQYRQAIADVFGADIKVAGRFEPEIRTDGLLAVGAAGLTISRAGYEQYDSMARGISAQVLDEKHRDAQLGCTPSSAVAPDDACARSFLARVGRLLLRRPLRPTELEARVAEANDAAAKLGDFHAGLQVALTGLLETPKFLFVTDSAEPDPARPGQRRLTGMAKAQRLSLLLWNALPDAELLDAAERGALHDPAGLQAQIDRLLASPRIETGVRAFFSDFLGFERFETLDKDPVIYPAFTRAVTVAAKEQALRTVTDHLLTRKADYRDLFTTRRTFMTWALGPVYAVPVESEEGWEPFEFAKNDPHAGLLTLASFTALYAHPGRSSATLRGKAVRELLLCQTVPAPPNNVNFSIVQDTGNADLRTARDRLTAHRSDPTCAGCHKIIDPIGLALEQFDGLGARRETENGAVIDASGDLDGSAFRDAAGLGRVLHDDPATVSCMVDSLYRYAAGRIEAPGEKAWLTWLRARFAADGYRLPDLLRRIASSDAFYDVSSVSNQEAAR